MAAPLQNVLDPVSTESSIDMCRTMSTKTIRSGHIESKIKGVEVFIGRSNQDRVFKGLFSKNAEDVFDGYDNNDRAEFWRIVSALLDHEVRNVKNDGACITLLYIDKNGMVTGFNRGDTEAWVKVADSTSEIKVKQLSTIDHPDEPAEKERLKRQCREVYKGRIGRGSLALSRCLGDDEYVPYGLSNEPHIFLPIKLNISNGDYACVFTDGVRDGLKNADRGLSAVINAHNKDDVAKELIELASKAQGNDDATAAIIDRGLICVFDGHGETICKSEIAKKAMEKLDSCLVNAMRIMELRKNSSQSQIDESALKQAEPIIAKELFASLVHYHGDDFNLDNLNKLFSCVICNNEQDSKEKLALIMQLITIAPDEFFHQFDKNLADLLGNSKLLPEDIEQIKTFFALAKDFYAIKDKTVNSLCALLIKYGEVKALGNWILQLLINTNIDLPHEQMMLVMQTLEFIYWKNFLKFSPEIMQNLTLDQILSCSKWPHERNNLLSLYYGLRDKTADELKSFILDMHAKKCLSDQELNLSFALSLLNINKNLSGNTRDKVLKEFWIYHLANSKYEIELYNYITDKNNLLPDELIVLFTCDDIIKIVELFNANPLSTRIDETTINYYFALRRKNISSQTYNKTDDNDPDSPKAAPAVELPIFGDEKAFKIVSGDSIDEKFAEQKDAVVAQPKPEIVAPVPLKDIAPIAAHCSTFKPVPPSTDADVLEQQLAKLCQWLSATHAQDLINFFATKDDCYFQIVTFIPTKTKLPSQKSFYESRHVIYDDLKVIDGVQIVPHSFCKTTPGYEGESCYVFHVIVKKTAASLTMLNESLVKYLGAGTDKKYEAVIYGDLGLNEDGQNNAKLEESLLQELKVSKQSVAGKINMHLKIGAKKITPDGEICEIKDEAVAAASKVTAP